MMDSGYVLETVMIEITDELNMVVRLSKREIRDNSQIWALVFRECIE